MPGPRVFIDANCLHKLYVRNLLLTLAAKSHLEPRWSREVLHEAATSLERRFQAQKVDFRSKLFKLTDTFQDAEVSGYDNLIGHMGCKDPKDEHVLAAAAHSRCEYLATFNLKDFPAVGNQELGLKIIHPDFLLLILGKKRPRKFLASVADWISMFNNPALTVEQAAAALENAWCPQTAEFLLTNRDRLNRHLTRF